MIFAPEKSQECCRHFEKHLFRQRRFLTDSELRHELIHFSIWDWKISVKRSILIVLFYM